MATPFAIYTAPTQNPFIKRVANGISYSTFSNILIANTLKYKNDTINFKSDDINFSGDIINFMGDSINFLGNAMLYKIDKNNFSGIYINYLGDDINFKGDTINFSSDGLTPIDYVLNINILQINYTFKLSNNASASLSDRASPPSTGSGLSDR